MATSKTLMNFVLPFVELAIRGLNEKGRESLNIVGKSCESTKVYVVVSVANIVHV